MCTSIRMSSLGCLPNWCLHGASGVDELEHRVEDEPQDHVASTGDSSLESKIDVIVVALEPIEGKRCGVCSCDLETNQNGHAPEEADRARSCYVGGSYSVFQQAESRLLHNELTK